MFVVQAEQTSIVHAIYFEIAGQVKKQNHEPRNFCYPITENLRRQTSCISSCFSSIYQNLV